MPICISLFNLILETGIIPESWLEGIIPENHWSCITHLGAEAMLKSTVIGEKKFKHSPRIVAHNPLGPKCLCQQEGLITMVICYKLRISSTSDFIHIFFMI